MCIIMENWSWNYQLILWNEQKLSRVDRYLWKELREEINIEPILFIFLYLYMELVYKGMQLL